SKHISARIAYLHKAAVYLTEQGHGQPAARTSNTPNCNLPDAKLDPNSGGLSLHLVKHMKQVAEKATIRLKPEVKRSICKRCNAVLIKDATAAMSTENQSHGQKPWANVYKIECRLCHAAKRFPIGAKRQLKKSKRR
ncbi:RNAse P, Rpr2/Rpp21 subunit, partial [Piedraia hortae CBS 480.64]